MGFKRFAKRVGRTVYRYRRPLMIAGGLASGLAGGYAGRIPAAYLGAAIGGRMASSYLLGSAKGAAMGYAAGPGIGMGLGGAYGTYRALRGSMKKRAPATGSRSGGMKTFKAPASMAVAAGGVTPSVSMRGETKIVSGQELIVTSITSATVGWQINPRIDINPISPLMPILAAEASSYQMYRFTSLSAQYENLCPSSTQGQLFMGTLADPADALPDSAQDATAIKNSVRNAMWVPSSFKFPCDGQFRYVDGSVATDADQRNINQFSFWYGTLGFGPTTTSAGTIRLNYTIELQKRIAPVSPGALDVRGFGNTTGILPALTSYVGTRRRGTWYDINPTTGLLTHKAPGKYAMQITIRSTDNIDVLTPFSSMAFEDVNGNAITPVSRYFINGYTFNSNTVPNVVSRSFTYSFADAGGTIDLSWVSSLTSIDMTISIDRL